MSKNEIEITAIISNYLDSWYKLHNTKLLKHEREKGYKELLGMCTKTYQRTDSPQENIEEMTIIYDGFKLLKGYTIDRIVIHDEEKIINGKVKSEKYRVSFPAKTRADVYIKCKLCIKKLKKWTKPVTMIFPLTLVKELGVYYPDIDGKWGVYPTSVYNITGNKAKIIY